MGELNPAATGGNRNFPESFFEYVWRLLDYWERSEPEDEQERRTR